MSTSDWVSTALADDTVVVEFLLRLKQSTAAAPSLPPPPRPPTLSWGCRQERSKPASATAKKERDSMMSCSPTTPLSWSCGGAASSASPSDDSCRPSDLSSVGRSKGVYTNYSIACSSANERSDSKRRKSFPKPEDGETLLLKEKSNLELETMHVTLKKQKVKSENFKRLETDIHQQSSSGIATKNSHYAEDLSFFQAKVVVETSSRIDHVPALNNGIQKHDDDHKVENNSFKVGKGFVLPDLNMMPSEDY